MSIDLAIFRVKISLYRRGLFWSVFKIILRNLTMGLAQFRASAVSAFSLVLPREAGNILTLLTRRNIFSVASY